MEPKTMRTFTVTVRGRAVTFTSAFETLADASAFLRTQDLSGNNFARDLLGKASLSPLQATWIHKLATDAKAASKHDTACFRLGAVITMMDNAAAQKRRPRIVLQTDGARQVVLTQAGEKASAPGTVTITDGRPYGASLYFGRIERDGSVKIGRDWTQQVETLLLKLAENPLAVAAQHGVATGQCCFCNRPLSTKESRSAGYGPICAEKFGLSWGSTAIADAADQEAKALATHFAAAAPKRHECVDCGAPTTDTYCARCNEIASRYGDAYNWSV
jgi:hypothetical protein